MCIRDSMISASHNPYYDNGIKVINEKGEKLEEAVITEIERYLDGKMEMCIRDSCKMYRVNTCQQVSATIAIRLAPASIFKRDVSTFLSFFMPVTSF